MYKPHWLRKLSLEFTIYKFKSTFITTDVKPSSADILIGLSGLFTKLAEVQLDYIAIRRLEAASVFSLSISSFLEDLTVLTNAFNQSGEFPSLYNGSKKEERMLSWFTRTSLLHPKTIADLPVLLGDLVEILGKEKERHSTRVAEILLNKLINDLLVVLKAYEVSIK